MKTYTINNVLEKTLVSKNSFKIVSLKVCKILAAGTSIKKRENNQMKEVSQVTKATNLTVQHK